MRKLASVKRIDNIVPIDNADAIECAYIGGWTVVIKKNEFNINDLVIYCEIDSWIPKEFAPFLFEGKTFEGVEGARLRTKKLRGQLSQGLILPLTIVNGNYIEGDDLTDILNIKKWEKPLDVSISGLAKGNFPFFIPNTDQERVQNLKRQIDDYKNESFQLSIKLDGRSITIYGKKEEQEYVCGVCSRNLELKEDNTNLFWIMANQYDVFNKIKKSNRSLAIQGELLSPKIQGNWEKVSEACMFVYDIFDIDNQKYLSPDETFKFCMENDIPHVPIIEHNFILNHSIFELLDMAEGEGMNKGVKREGLVFKHNNSDFSFKVISNSYLLKNKEA